MTYFKTIVCLANSYKAPSGRCIVGKEITAEGYGGWIRPVSGRPYAELSSWEYRYDDGTIPKLLDIVDVPLARPVPHNHQTENHLIDDGRRWVKRGEFPWQKLEELCERPPSLWINSGRTSTGNYDCVSRTKAKKLRNSLLLIKRKNFTVKVTPNSYDGKRTVRGAFEYQGVRHNLSLTDPVARSAFWYKGLGDYPLQDVYLCLSLTEVFQADRRCHKLVAAVISDRLM